VGKIEKKNIEHRTSNIERRRGKLAKRTYDLEERLLKRNANSHSRVGNGCVKTNEIKLPSEATSFYKKIGQNKSAL